MLLHGCSTCPVPRFYWGARRPGIVPKPGGRLGNEVPWVWFESLVCVRLLYLNGAVSTKTQTITKGQLDYVLLCTSLRQVMYYGSQYNIQGINRSLMIRATMLFSLSYF